MVDQLQLREKEIFETLKKIKKSNFVVIGGYAVNAYTLPRFSVDCDIVIKNKNELGDIEDSLIELGYYKVKHTSETSYEGKFERYEKEISPNFNVSVDILIGEILDRDTKAKFSADWVFENSDLRNLKGKTINEQLKLKIIDSEALFAMKMISCRQTDIRDMFLLINSVKDTDWIKKEVAERFDFKNRFSKLIKEISSKQFKDGLQGVFGIIDNKIFERNVKLVTDLNKSS